MTSRGLPSGVANHFPRSSRRRRGPSSVCLGTALLLFTLLAHPGATAAQTSVPPGRVSTLVAHTENDDWWPDTGTDKNYTNALRVTIDRNYDMWRLQRFGKLFAWIPKYADCATVATTSDPSVRCLSTSWHILGQQFYTPDDITIPTLIPFDRPYAGWLYMGGAWRSSTYNSLTETDFYLGVTGRASLSEPVQTFWHKLVGAAEPRGWSNQIGGRLGVVASHNRRRAFEALTGSGLRWFELVPYAGGTVGNIIVDAQAGARLRLGYNLSRDWRQLGISPRVSTRSARRARTDPPGFEFYLVLDSQARALPYNAFIDAATNHSLDRNLFVADGGIGIGVRVKRFGFSYRVAFVTPEYDEALTHDYKALRFTFAF